MRRAGGTQGEAQHEEREDHAPSTRSARRQKRHARRDYDQNVVTSLKFSSPAAGLFLYPDDPRRRNFILIPSRFPKVIRYTLYSPPDLNIILAVLTGHAPRNKPIRSLLIPQA